MQKSSQQNGRNGSRAVLLTQLWLPRMHVRNTLDSRHDSDCPEALALCAKCMARPCVARRKVERANVKAASMYQTSGMEH